MIHSNTLILKRIMTLGFLWPWRTGASVLRSLPFPRYAMLLETSEEWLTVLFFIFFYRLKLNQNWSDEWIIGLKWWMDYWIIGDECQMISFKIASSEHKQQKSILFWNLKKRSGQTDAKNQKKNCLQIKTIWTKQKFSATQI